MADSWWIWSPRPRLVRTPLHGDGLRTRTKAAKISVVQRSISAGDPHATSRLYLILQKRYQTIRLTQG